MGKSKIPKSLSDFFSETSVRFGTPKCNHTHSEVGMSQQAREVKRRRWRDNLLNRSTKLCMPFTIDVYIGSHLGTL